MSQPRQRTAANPSSIITSEHLVEALAPARSARALIALDVDGTLVDHNGSMDPAVRSALNDVREAGHHVVIATGRALAQTLPIVRLAGVVEGWAVSSNGAVTARIDGAADTDVTITDTVTFNPEPALRAMKNAVPDAQFAVEKADGGFLITGALEDLVFDLEATSVDFDDLLAEKRVTRVVVTAQHIPTDEFVQVVRDAGVEGCEYAIGWSSWMDVSAPGVTKASALEALRQHLGVDPAHTIAMGDGWNDIDMLRWAGTSFAMGQADPTVREAATAVTYPVSDHGAAYVLRGLLAVD